MFTLGLINLPGTIYVYYPQKILNAYASMPEGYMHLILREEAGQSKSCRRVNYLQASSECVKWLYLSQTEISYSNSNITLLCNCSLWSNIICRYAQCVRSPLKSALSLLLLNSVYSSRKYSLSFYWDPQWFPVTGLARMWWFPVPLI